MLVSRGLQSAHLQTLNSPVSLDICMYIHISAQFDSYRWCLASYYFAVLAAAGSSYCKIVRQLRILYIRHPGSDYYILKPDYLTKIHKINI